MWLPHHVTDIILKSNICSKGSGSKLQSLVLIGETVFGVFMHTKSRLMQELIHRNIKEGRRRAGWERDAQIVGNKANRISAEGYTG